MNTVISNWQIVSVMDGEKLIGKVLWGTVVDDSTCRFYKGNYVCTSRIIKINLDSRLVTTATGSLYQLIGNGNNKQAKIDIDDFELLRHGFSPEQIRSLNHFSSMAN
ncbi:hypothetical protein [Pseudoalteromonas sp. JSTW]|uniref:DUF6957 family protein n=1 Tax=Pseudoalteromonas sp. JSTW TaxID=2752475 RepID=UPI0015D55824|nr:hypothetical protein [Pseudoalteromonas sp. JSTW]QLJ07242.1 hypothetical protein GZH31_10580 [Pseudoalteromonas sp. JSTW]